MRRALVALYVGVLLTPLLAIVPTGLWFDPVRPAAAAVAWSQLGVDIDGEAEDDESGTAVALSADGTRLAVGAPFNEGPGSFTGHVRVYEWSGTAWVQLGSDIDGEAGDDQFGYSVALSADGSRLVVGAVGNSDGGLLAGHARVYEWSGTAWVQLGSDIDGEAAFDQSGWSVSIAGDGSRIAVGAPVNGVGALFAGHVRVYEWSGTAWVQLGADIDGESAEDQSGWSVSMSTDGARLAIGAPNADGSAGHVRVYEWSGTAWVQLGSDIDGEAADDQSGWSVSLAGDGSRVAVGAPGNTGAAGPLSGHTRVFEWSGTAWVQLGSDIDGEADSDDSGYAVSLSGDGSRLAVGAIANGGTAPDAGHVRAFQWDGAAWVQLDGDLDGEDDGDLSGWSVSVSADGSLLAVGAPLNEFGTGHTRVWSMPPPTVTNDALDDISLVNAAAYPVSGTCFADGDTVMVSASDGSLTTTVESVPCTAGAFAAVLDTTALADGPVTVTSEIDDGANPVASDADVVTKSSAPAASPVIYVSSTTGGNVGGVGFNDEDILAFDVNSGDWEMFFDGSDVGLGVTFAQDVDAFTLLDDGSMLFSIRAAATIAGVGSVDDSDILRFVPTSTGTTTAGTITMHFDGSDVGLTTSGEDVSAIGVTDDGRIVISTYGTANVPGAVGNLTARDEDLLVFNDSSLGPTTAGSFELLFDGSDITLTLGSEDVWGADLVGTSLYLNTRGAFEVSGLVGARDDILECASVTTGFTSACGDLSLVELTGFASEEIDGIDITGGIAAAPMVDEIADRSDAVGDTVSLPVVVTSADGPWTFEAEDLPAGLVIDPSSGVISGVPTTVGTSTVTVTVTNAAGVATRVSFDWTIATPAQDVTEPDTAIITPARNATLPAGPLTALGTVTDDISGVAQVRIAFRNRSTGEWLKSDGTFSPGFQWQMATVADPGSNSTTWSYDVTLPAGSLAVVTQGIDVAGNREMIRPWHVFVTN